MRPLLPGNPPGFPGLPAGREARRSARPPAPPPGPGPPRSKRPAPDPGQYHPRVQPSRAFVNKKIVTVSCGRSLRFFYLRSLDSCALGQCAANTEGQGPSTPRGAKKILGGTKDEKDREADSQSPGGSAKKVIHCYLFQVSSFNAQRGDAGR